MPDRKAKTGAKPTGYVRVIERKGGAVFYGKLKLPDGTQPQRRLGTVWTKRTRPPDGYLSRGMAEARLQAILAGDDPLVNVAPSHVTFKQACDEHLRYLEHDRERKPSYLRDCRSIVRCYLLPALGESTPVEDITTGAVDGLREQLLSTPRIRRRDDDDAAPLAHKTAQKVLVLLGGILGRAKRKGWITTNPCENAENVAVKRSDDFNVLDVEQVHAVARAAPDEQLAVLFSVAAFTGAAGRNPRPAVAACRLREPHPACPTQPRRRHDGGGHTEIAPSSQRPAIGRARRAQSARALHWFRRSRLLHRDRRALNDDVVRSAFYAALKDADLGRLRAMDEPIVFHDLRHTFGTQCAATGIDLRRIQAWMGHANIQTTMRYLHYVPQHDDAARLTAAFAPAKCDPGSRSPVSKGVA